MNNTSLEIANKITTEFEQIFKHPSINSKLLFDITVAPFDDEKEVGIEINFDELLVNLVVKEESLYLLEIEVMYEELQGKGIATSVVETFKNIAIKLDLITFEITGIHNKKMYSIGEKLGLTKTNQRSVILKIKDK